MVKIKYVGKGLVSRGIKFSQTQNDGLYDLSKEDYEYLSKTFPDSFIIIENSVKQPKKEQEPKTKRATRRKKED